MMRSRDITFAKDLYKEDSYDFEIPFCIEQHQNSKEKGFISVLLEPSIIDAPLTLRLANTQNSKVHILSRRLLSVYTPQVYTTTMDTLLADNSSTNDVVENANNIELVVNDTEKETTILIA